jgi:hypothetical protein
MNTYDAMMRSALRTWADTGVTPTSHVIGGFDGCIEIKHATPQELDRARPTSDYKIMARNIEIARRGPPRGFRPWGVCGWVCFDVKEGWRPILSGQA